MKLKHFIEPDDLSSEEYEIIFGLAEQILQRPQDFYNRCEGRILASLFFEPSTRTRFSFEAAMLRLGGKVISLTDANISSLKKGESIEDTIRIVEGYADICAIRHPQEFTPHKLAPYLTTMNLINAGDGSNAHPTQTLTDLVTIREEKGRLNNLKIGFCGDLKYGRTVHSLLSFMQKQEGNYFYFISPEELKLPDKYYESLDSDVYQDCQSLEECLEDLDILYMTRVQAERFSSAEEAEYFRLRYVLDQEKLDLAESDLAVMHPLPRVGEINPEIDKDPRALYFKQARYGMIARMALIIFLLESKGYDKSEDIKKIINFGD